MIKAPYRSYPGPNGTTLLYPLIRIRLGRKHGPITRDFEAMVDSGAADCLFPESIALALGIKMESGTKEMRRGIGGNQDVWIHPVVLYVGPNALNISAAFCKMLPVAGLLGRKGFFEHFRITFDPSSEPPGLEIERVNKA
jgi:hypothetical protein